MTPAEILAGIRAVARRHVGVERDLEPGFSLQGDLLLDSLQLLTLAVEVENHFQIRLDPQDEARIRTVGDLVAVVSEKLVRVVP